MADDPIVDFGVRRPPAPARDALPPVSDAFRQRADRWKRELLDLTRRNRGINFRPTRTTLPIPALPADLWQTLLVAEGGIAFTARNFAPDAPQPVADDRAVEAFAAATRLIERARLADREQGIQVLFAALGWLTSKDSENSNRPLPPTRPSAAGSIPAALSATSKPSRATNPTS